MSATFQIYLHVSVSHLYKTQIQSYRSPDSNPFVTIEPVFLSSFFVHYVAPFILVTLSFLIVLHV